MKKILLATSALVLSAGVAQAQMTVNGFSYMGITNVTSGPLGTTGAATVRYGTRLFFNATVRGDHGLVFTSQLRANFRNNTTAGYPANTFNAGTAVDPLFDRLWVRAAASGFSLTVGNTNGALRTLARTVSAPGFDADRLVSLFDTAIGVSDGNQNAIAQYATGPWSVAVSSSLSGNVIEGAVRYSDGGITVGAGIGTGSIWSIHAGYAMGDWGAQVGYASDGLGGNRLVVLGTYRMGDLTLGVALQNQVGDFQATNGTLNTNNGTRYGANATYALGGGAVLEGSVGVFEGVGNAYYGLGVRFPF